MYIHTYIYIYIYIGSWKIFYTGLVFLGRTPIFEVVLAVWTTFSNIQNDTAVYHDITKTLGLHFRFRCTSLRHFRFTNLVILFH